MSVLTFAVTVDQLPASENSRYFVNTAVVEPDGKNPEASNPVTHVLTSSGDVSGGDISGGGNGGGGSTGGGSTGGSSVKPIPPAVPSVPEKEADPNVPLYGIHDNLNPGGDMYFPSGERLPKTGDSSLWMELWFCVCSLGLGGWVLMEGRKKKNR